MDFLYLFCRDLFYFFRSRYCPVFNGGFIKHCPVQRNHVSKTDASNLERIIALGKILWTRNWGRAPKRKRSLIVFLWIPENQNKSERFFRLLICTKSFRTLIISGIKSKQMIVKSGLILISFVILLSPFRFNLFVHHLFSYVPQSILICFSFDCLLCLCSISV